MDISRSTGSELTIRAAGPEDVPAVLDLWREADAEPSVGDDPVTVGRITRFVKTFEPNPSRR